MGLASDEVPEMVHKAVMSLYLSVGSNAWLQLSYLQDGSRGKVSLRLLLHHRRDFQACFGGRIYDTAVGRL